MPRTAACSACVPLAGKLTSSGRAPRHSAVRLAGRLEQKCGPATGRIQSSRIRPAVTEGRDECLSRDRVQRRPRRRVEVGHHDTTLVAHLRHNRRPLTAAAYQVQYAPD